MLDHPTVCELQEGPHLNFRTKPVVQLKVHISMPAACKTETAERKPSTVLWPEWQAGLANTEGALSVVSNVFGKPWR